MSFRSTNAACIYIYHMVHVDASHARQMHRSCNSSDLNFTVDKSTISCLFIHSFYFFPVAVVILRPAKKKTNCLYKANVNLDENLMNLYSSYYTPN